MKDFTTYELKLIDLTANQIRMMRKLLTDVPFDSWLEARGLGREAVNEPANPVWEAAMAQVEEEAEKLASSGRRFRERRVMDEYEYASKFKLAWPSIGATK